MFERESAGSQAMEIESEREDSVNDSSGVIVVGPSEYLRYIPKLFFSVQNKLDLAGGT